VMLLHMLWVPSTDSRQRESKIPDKGLHASHQMVSSMLPSASKARHGCEFIDHPAFNP
jgi:hypothetical protein